jgi:phospholipid/cholesterol/gamma-HCH transport system permease protein
VASVPVVVTSKARGVLTQIGELFTIALEGLRRTWDVRNWFWEFVEQCWFLARVTTLPVILIALPLGATVALQVGDLAAQLGAQSALIIAGAGGSAMTSDMGARRIRDELSAMEVMAVNPIHRLVTPRMWAASLVSTMLSSLVILSGAVGGFFFNVLLQNVTPGAYFDGALSLLRTSDLVVTLFKAWLFGLIAAMVACYKGMTCAQSPVGVGRAVNQATVIALMLVFAFNYIITTIYVLAYPPKV